MKIIVVIPCYINHINHLINYSKKIQNNYLFSLDEITKIKNIKKKLLANYKSENFNNIIEYLLIRRKHSLNYVEFIRGKYDINNSIRFFDC